MAPSVLSQRAVHRFLGYLDGQRQRLLGVGRRGRVPNRPELVAEYGYEVKYATHALRLAYQGLEIARDGRLTLPMPEAERERVLRVKRGDVPALADVLGEIAAGQAQVEELLAMGRTPLRAEPDRDTITGWSVDAHRRHWGWSSPAANGATSSDPWTAVRPLIQRPVLGPGSAASGGMADRMRAYAYNQARGDVCR